MPWLWPLQSAPVWPDYPGTFGAVRTHDIHTGVDLYTGVGERVLAVEEGVVVKIENFTGESAGSPWWNETKAVLIEGPTGVVCYGEIEPSVSVGDTLAQGAVIGHVLQVLKKNKGRPQTMLHIELYEFGHRETLIWSLGDPQPSALRDPTPFLKGEL